MWPYLNPNCEPVLFHVFLSSVQLSGGFKFPELTLPRVENLQPEQHSHISNRAEQLVINMYVHICIYIHRYNICSMESSLIFILMTFLQEAKLPVSLLHLVFFWLNAVPLCLRLAYLVPLFCSIYNHTSKSSSNLPSLLKPSFTAPGHSFLFLICTVYNYCLWYTFDNELILLRDRRRRLIRKTNTTIFTCISPRRAVWIKRWEYLLKR